MVQRRLVLVDCGQVEKVGRNHLRLRADATRRLLIVAADQADPKGQHALGECYKWGRGVEKNDETAFSYFWKAAEQGDADAQGSVGYCYQSGEGIPRNPFKAFHWFSLGAQQGHPRCQMMLGQCYEQAEG
ncbi:MAG: sel1 repeat family protein, partial [Proteobacteria bacterium]|nr:sel1 repeat family protein [Pseudomonadota bacterium]